MNAVVIRYAATLPSVANIREHWAKKAKRAKQQREEAFLRVRQVQNDPVFGSEHGIVVTMVRIAPRRLDSHDNLRSAFKAAVDGAADAMGIKDNDPRVLWAYEQQKGVPKEQAIEIRIEPREAKAAGKEAA